MQLCKVQIKFLEIEITLKEFNRFLTKFSNLKRKNTVALIHGA